MTTTTVPDPITIQIPARYAHLHQIRHAVLTAAATAGLPPDRAAQIELAVDEACANIIEHSYGPTRIEQARTTPDAIRINLHPAPGLLTIEIHDRGNGFDFAATDTSSPQTYFDEHRIRGLGQYIIRRLADEATYQRSTPHGHCLRLTKRA